MCAQPAPAADSNTPGRPRITPLQWVGLAVLILLFLYQSGLLRLSSPSSAVDLVLEYAPLVVAFVLAIAGHEFSHGLVATLFGDDTPRRAGRLTLNPLKHLDPMGTLLIFVAGFGWGRPMPISPPGMTHPALGWALSSVAGPISNFILAAAGALLYHADLRSLGEAGLLLHEFAAVFVGINVLLGLFNLIPLPPLDGYGFIFGLAPNPIRRLLAPLFSYGPWLLLALIFLPRIVPGFPPVISMILQPASRALFNFFGVRF